MSNNPFDAEDGTFCVLVNAEGQHSLWPSFAPVPEGWTVTLRDAAGGEALEHIARTWTDMRPRSVAEASPDR